MFANATLGDSMSRSPYGERGLKLHKDSRRQSSLSSLSLRRAWIEIGQQAYVWDNVLSLSLRRAWIEIAG